MKDHLWLIGLGLFVLVCVALVALAIISIIFHPLIVAGTVGLLGLFWCIGWAIEALMRRAP